MIWEHNKPPMFSDKCRKCPWQSRSREFPWWIRHPLHPPSPRPRPSFWHRREIEMTDTATSKVESESLKALTCTPEFRRLTPKMAKWVLLYCQSYIATGMFDARAATAEVYDCHSRTAAS